MSYIIVGRELIFIYLTKLMILSQILTFLSLFFIILKFISLKLVEERDYLLPVLK